MKYSKIVIIYNPNSTGDSEAKARELYAELQRHMPKIDCQCVPTKGPGHARKLARQAAAAKKQPLIISSSGDGGYNEVINGVMEAGNPKVVCTVLSAGNANDHSTTMQQQPLLKAILQGKPKKIDLIKLTISKPSASPQVYYAHSYIGLGLTPVIATELNRHSLNAFREVVIVLKTFFKYRPFKIQHQGKMLRLDSLLFANINRMAKVLTLAPRNQPSDGKFEIIPFPTGHKWDLFKRLTKAAAHHLEHTKQASSYEFTVIKKMPLQMDGEVVNLAPGSKVVIESAKQALLTLT